MKTNDQMLCAYRGSLQAMLDGVNAYLSSAERFRAHQLKMIRETLGENAQAAKKIESAASFEELLALRTDFSQAQAREVARYWGGLHEAVSRNNVDAMREMQEAVMQIGDGIRLASGDPAAGAEPFSAALKSMVDAASSLCALTVTASEDAASFTAGQAHPRSAAAYGTRGDNPHKPAG